MKKQKKIYNKNTELVTLLIAGSVDDGKSTLIGRLLYDTGELYDDQLEAVQKAGKMEGELDFSLFTDGLSAEREQKITIDVAYRYFSTAKRRFIVADVPGHKQYTRNMVTGASKAQLALLLVDARKGLLPQSKHHLTVCALLGIKNIAVIVNKMDLVSYDEERFFEIKKDFESFANKLQIPDLQFIPTSSLRGDMIVERGENIPWYSGHTVLNYLENITINANRNLIDFRFPVQYVIRPHQDMRAYAGKIEGGIIRKDEEVVILPSGQESQVKSIIFDNERQDYAFNPQSVALELTDEVDVSRGDVIVRKNNIPEISENINTMVCWMDKEKMKVGKNYLLKHNSSTVRCVINKINYRLNTEDLHRERRHELKLNEVGRVQIFTNQPLIFDPYLKNRNTGSFILVDESGCNTVGAGTIVGKTKQSDKKEKQEKKGVVLWFTGLSGSGKSTIADGIYKYLQDKNISCERLDGDILRDNLTTDFGFSKEGREKNLAVAGFVAKMLAKNGVTVVASFISPYRETRENFKKDIDSFTEIFVNCSLEVCEKRDVKGLYKKARLGEIEGFTGVSHPYEEPKSPDLELKTDEESQEDSIKKVISFLEK